MLQLLKKIVFEKTASANEPTRTINSVRVIYTLKGLHLATSDLCKSEYMQIIGDF